LTREYTGTMEAPPGRLYTCSEIILAIGMRDKTLGASPVVWRTLYVISKTYLTLYHRCRNEGVEHIPKHGPLLITPNHLSFLDPFAVGVALIDRHLAPGVDFGVAGKEEVFRNPLLAQIGRGMGMFPLHRERLDMAAMRTMLQILNDGKMLGLAPEGTRSPTGHLQLFQPVVAKMVISRHTPILPVGVIGSEKAMPIGMWIPHPVPITVRFGPVFELAEYYDRALTEELLDCAAAQMRTHVAALLPVWMREPPPATVPHRFGARQA
jgi:1-acyl-sn-glycerol-3-phosphate acyltransferase